ncbi:hypothetical protein [Streptomyces sp. NPDC001388]
MSHPPRTDPLGVAVTLLGHHPLAPRLSTHTRHQPHTRPEETPA